MGYWNQVFFHWELLLLLLLYIVSHHPEGILDLWSGGDEARGTPSQGAGLLPGYNARAFGSFESMGIGNSLGDSAP